ncbi:hypothetical protein CCHR01_16525 [Colletotrichum chrysophilum]|uniref:Uncharacterized protein n=1 Tax=Colletotrichum chrysophilum TaxID=1836956 RepID=A0AAD9A3M7_9PEZI|nr:hypothetical protein K456DRAFT_696218 [Colletotrichum gloeosporioides 23]KAK1840846.1 hypothetical protein CCHR01_16525 [Colletotrichum chrysophilum]
MRTLGFARPSPYTRMEASRGSAVLFAPIQACRANGESIGPHAPDAGIFVGSEAGPGDCDPDPTVLHRSRPAMDPGYLTEWNKRLSAGRTHEEKDWAADNCEVHQAFLVWEADKKSARGQYCQHARNENAPAKICWESIPIRPLLHDRLGVGLCLASWRPRLCREKIGIILIPDA